MSRESIIVETTRLVNFLDGNQLVQAHAITSKLEGQIRDQLEQELRDSLGPDGKHEQLALEKHPLWVPYRQVHLTRQAILNGKREEAAKSAKAIFSLVASGEK